MAEQKTLEIILKARDLAGRPIEALKDRIQRARDAINQNDSKGGLGGFAKSIGDLGQLARAMSAVEIAGNAAEGVMKAGSAWMKSLKGDAEGSLEDIKAVGEAFGKVPAAGMVYRGANLFGEMLFGDQADADKAVKEIEKIEAALKRAAADAKERKKEILFAEGFGQELQSRGRTRGLEGNDLAAEQQRIRYEQERAKLTESMETMRRNSIGLNNAALEAEMAGHYQALEALAQDHAAAMRELQAKQYAQDKAAEEQRNNQAEQNRRTTARIIEDAQRQAYMDELKTREDALRTSGATAAAEAVAIKAAWVREAHGINDAKAAALDALPPTATKEEADAVVESYRKSYDAAWDRFQFAQGRHEQQKQQQRDQARKGFAERVGDIEFEARQRELEAMGEHGRARQERLDRDLSAELARIKQHAEEAVKAGVDPAEAERLRQRAEAATRGRFANDASPGPARRGADGFDAQVMRFLPAAMGLGKAGGGKPRIETLTEQQLNEQRALHRTLAELLNTVRNSPGLSPAGF